MGAPYAEVIGDPIAHSKSPLIHRFWLEKLGIEGDYRATRVESDRLHLYFAERRGDPDWRGCNVTMPHKSAALAYMGRLDSSAEKCRALNLVVPGPDGARRGYNSDMLAIGAILGRFEKRDYPNKVATYVQIVGAGGAARAAAVGAVAAGYMDFDFFNRTLNGAQAMAVWFGLMPDAYAAPLHALGPIRNLDDGDEDQRYSQILINATSLGMEGKPDLEVDLESYYPDTIVIDLPYRDDGTELVRKARALGLRVADGLEVLVEQAACGFEHLFGVPAPRAHDEELRERLTS